MEGVEEVLPHYWSIVINGVKTAQEFSKVSNPACYFFAFDIHQGEGSLGNGGLVIGDCPIYLKIELQFIEEIVG